VDNCACAIGRLLHDPPTCALPIDPSVALHYQPIAQIAQTRATYSLLLNKKSIFLAQCYCGWKFSRTNSANLLKWLKIQPLRNRDTECYCGWKFSRSNSENLLKWLKIQPLKSVVLLRLKIQPHKLWKFT